MASRRAVQLAANMETALNALWDSGAGPGDRIVVVGAGIVGLMGSGTRARLPGCEVTVIDLAADRRPLVESFGARFMTAVDNKSGADVVFHTSVSAAGLNTAIAAAGLEGIVELSWYGDRETPVRLGGAFHSQRLKLISSTGGPSVAEPAAVGTIAAAWRRPSASSPTIASMRWSPARSPSTTLRELPRDSGTGCQRLAR